MSSSCLTAAEAICNSSSRQVIGRELYRHYVSGQDLYGIFSHLSARMCKDLMFVLQFHLVGAMGHILNDFAAHLDWLFFGHVTIHLHLSLVSTQLGGLAPMDTVVAKDPALPF